MPVFTILLCLLGLALCGLAFFVFAGAWATAVFVVAVLGLAALDLIRARLRS